jgi:DNA-binding IclR family transcriptional regulator
MNELATWLPFTKLPNNLFSKRLRPKSIYVYWIIRSACFDGGKSRLTVRASIERICSVAKLGKHTVSRELKRLVKLGMVNIIGDAKRTKNYARTYTLNPLVNDWFKSPSFGHLMINRGLTTTQAAVLLCVMRYRYSESGTYKIRATKMAKLLVCSRMTIHRAINELRKNRWLEYIIDTDDEYRLGQGWYLLTKEVKGHNPVSSHILHAFYPNWTDQKMTSPIGM